MLWAPLPGNNPPRRSLARQTDGVRVAALLRGVNLGKRQVKMADLRAAVEGLGHTDVATYLQSGNVVFMPATRGLGGLSAQLTTALGMEITVVLRTGKELAAVVAAIPYPVDDPTKVVVTFLADRVPARPWTTSTSQRSRRTSSRSRARSSTSSCPTAKPAPS